MKNIIIVFAILILLISCKDRIVYNINDEYIVPDSLKEKQREWVTETIRAANQHLSAGDYEDIPETINEIYDKSFRLFCVKVKVLQKNKWSSVNDVTLLWSIQEEHLNEHQKKIFDSLKCILNK